MTAGSAGGVDEALLDRLTRQVQAYAVGDQVRRSRMDRVLQRLHLQVDEASDLRGPLEGALSRQGFRVMDDAAVTTPPEQGAVICVTAKTGPVRRRARGGVRTASDGEAHADGSNAALSWLRARAESVNEREEYLFDLRLTLRQGRRLLVESARLKDPSSRLLTREEEIGLAALMRQASGLRLDEELPQDFRVGVETNSEAAQAHDALLVHNLRLVRSVAHRQGHYAESSDPRDLVGYGVVGLLRAVQKFDGTKGHRFSTYATWWIRQSVTRALADFDRMIRLPVHVAEQVDQVTRARRLLEARGTEATPVALMRETGDSPEDLSRLLLLARPVSPLDALLPFEEEELQVDRALLAEHLERTDPFSALSQRMLTEAVAAVVGSLSDREADVVRGRFGFLGEPETLEQIGTRLGLTRERIRQIESKVLSKLRHGARVRKLQDWVGAALPSSSPADTSTTSSAVASSMGRGTRAAQVGRDTTPTPPPATPRSPKTPVTASPIAASDLKDLRAFIAQYGVRADVDRVLLVVLWAETHLGRPCDERRIRAWLTEVWETVGSVFAAMNEAAANGWLKFDASTGSWRTTPSARGRVALHHTGLTAEDEISPPRPTVAVEARDSLSEPTPPTDAHEQDERDVSPGDWRSEALVLGLVVECMRRSGRDDASIGEVRELARERGLDQAAVGSPLLQSLAEAGQLHRVPPNVWTTPKPERSGPSRPAALDGIRDGRTGRREGPVTSSRGVDAPALTPESIPAAAGSQGAAAVDDGTAGGTRVPDDLKLFLAHKQPATAQERVTCMLYALHGLTDRTTVSPAELDALNRDCGGSTFAAAGSALQSAQQSGLVRRVDTAQWSITEDGRRLVDELPRRSASAWTSSRGRPRRSDVRIREQPPRPGGASTRRSAGVDHDIHLGSATATGREST